MCQPDPLPTYHTWAILVLCFFFMAHLAQDHALADKALEGLFSGYQTYVVQHLVPEPRIQQMQDCMLSAACTQRCLSSAKASAISSCCYAVLGTERGEALHCVAFQMQNGHVGKGSPPTYRSTGSQYCSTSGSTGLSVFQGCRYRR